MVTIKQVRDAFNKLYCVGCCNCDCHECEISKIEEPLIKMLENVEIVNLIDEETLNGEE